MGDVVSIIVDFVTETMHIQKHGVDFYNDTINSNLEYRAMIKLYGKHEIQRLEPIAQSLSTIRPSWKFQNSNSTQSFVCCGSISNILEY